MKYIRWLLVGYLPCSSILQQLCREKIGYKRTRMQQPCTDPSHSFLAYKGHWTVTDHNVKKDRRILRIILPKDRLYPLTQTPRVCWMRLNI